MRSGGVDGSFVDEKDRNPVPHRIHSPARPTFQAFMIRGSGERLLAGRADQDVEQILRNHGGIVPQWEERSFVFSDQANLEDGRPEFSGYE